MAKFPDLNKDGKVTQKDILMGRGVNLASGGRIVYRENAGKAGSKVPKNDPVFKKDETRQVGKANMIHSKKADDANKKEIEKAGKYGDGVFMRGNHINYMDDDD